MNDTDFTIATLLRDVEQHLHHIRKHTVKQPFIDELITVSANKAYLLDYKDYAYIFAYSGTTVSLSLEDIGSVTIAANTWTSLCFPPGTRLFMPAALTTLTPILIRCTDTLYTVNGTFNLGQIGGTSAQALALGQAGRLASVPVTMANDQPAQGIQGDYLEVGSPGAPLTASALNADLLDSIDVSRFKYVSIQIVGTWVGTIQFQASNENTNFILADLTTPNPGSTSNSFQTTVNGLFVGPLSYRYFRARMTAYTSGTAQAIVQFYTVPPPQLHMFATTTQQGGTTFTVIPGNTQNTTPWLVNIPGSDVTVLASASRTTTQTQADQTNNSARGIKVVLDMTDVTASPSVQLEIDGKDVVSGKYYSLLTGANVTTVSTNVYTVYPTLPAVANVTAQDVLPHVYRIKVTAVNANAGTYSVGASLLP